MLRLRKWQFDLDTGVTTEEDLSDIPCEFPVIDPRKVGLPNRFVYASTLDASIAEPLPVNGFLRHDLHNGTVHRITFENGRRGGVKLYPVFTVGLLHVLVQFYI